MSHFAEIRRRNGLYHPITPFKGQWNSALHPPCDSWHHFGTIGTDFNGYLGSQRLATPNYHNLKFSAHPKRWDDSHKNWCSSQTNGPILKVSTTIKFSAQGRSFQPKKIGILSSFVPSGALESGMNPPKMSHFAEIRGRNGLYHQITQFKGQWNSALHPPCDSWHHFGTIGP